MYMAITNKTNDAAMHPQVISMIKVYTNVHKGHIKPINLYIYSNV